MAVSSIIIVQCMTMHICNRQMTDRRLFRNNSRNAFSSSLNDVDTRAKCVSPTQRCAPPSTILQSLLYVTSFPSPPHPAASSSSDHVTAAAGNSWKSEPRGTNGIGGPFAMVNNSDAAVVVAEADAAAGRQYCVDGRRDLV